jgi:hypothetical protein
MDYQKTFETYQKYGMGKKFEQQPDYARYKKELGWYEKVKSPRTCEYYQAQGLIERELVPVGWKPPPTDSKGKPIKYPIKDVNEIIRKRLVDGSEWILSRQYWTGLDSTGNEVGFSMNDKDCFDDVLPVYSLKPENPKDNPRYKDIKMVSTIDRVERRIKYTEPFKPETAKKLYDMRNGKCSLCLIDKSGIGGHGNHPSVSVSSFESLKNSVFQDLFELLITPKYKMEQSTTQEYQKQYG